MRFWTIFLPYRVECPKCFRASATRLGFLSGSTPNRYLNHTHFGAVQSSISDGFWTGHTSFVALGPPMHSEQNWRTILNSSRLVATYTSSRILRKITKKYIFKFTNDWGVHPWASDFPQGMQNSCVSWRNNPQTYKVKPPFGPSTSE